MPEDPAFHKDVDYDVHEHGRRWAVCRACGAQWSIHDSNRGEVYELVSDGDESCMDQD